MKTYEIDVTHTVKVRTRHRVEARNTYEASVKLGGELATDADNNPLGDCLVHLAERVEADATEGNESSGWAVEDVDIDVQVAQPSIVDQ